LRAVASGLMMEKVRSMGMALLASHSEIWVAAAK
jgi:hypothetical protein